MRKQLGENANRKDANLNKEEIEQVVKNNSVDDKESSRKRGNLGNMELPKGPVVPGENDSAEKGRIRRVFVDTRDSAFPDLSLAVPALQTVVYSRSEKECIRNPHKRLMAFSF